MHKNFWFFDQHEQRNIALVTEHNQLISYAQLQEDIDIFSRKLPIQRSLVFLKVENTYLSVIAYLSCLQNNHPFLPIDSQIDTSLFTSLLDLYQPNLIINEGSIEPYCEFKYELYSDLAMLLSTSGTTGASKLVRLSYQNLASNTSDIIKYLQITSADTVITTLPMSYSYGISVVNTHLGGGATIILNDSGIISRDFWNKIETHTVTTFAGVPFIFQMLKKLNYKRFNTASIRYLTQAGGKLDEETLIYFEQECSEVGQKFFVMYGQTEASPRISYVPVNQLKDKIGSIGIAIPNGKIDIHDSNGKLITQANVEGEIVYTGINVMLGYAETSSDFALGDIQGNILHTGDLGYFDEEYYFYITGRAKRFIKLFGLRISLDSLDNWLANNNIDAVSCGNDDKLVVCYENESLDISTIKKRIAQCFKLNANIVHFMHIKQIPRKNGGKVDFKSLSAIVNSL
jgi:long-chain acyl-CoA synthetase